MEHMRPDSRKRTLDRNNEVSCRSAGRSESVRRSQYESY